MSNRDGLHNQSTEHSTLHYNDTVMNRNNMNNFSVYTLIDLWNMLVSSK